MEVKIFEKVTRLGIYDSEQNKNECCTGKQTNYLKPTAAHLVSRASVFERVKRAEKYRVTIQRLKSKNKIA